LLPCHGTGHGIPPSSSIRQVTIGQKSTEYLTAMIAMRLANILIRHPSPRDAMPMSMAMTHFPLTILQMTSVKMMMDHLESPTKSVGNHAAAA
jgi:hypothetical protein